VIFDRGANEQQRTARLGLGKRVRRAQSLTRERYLPSFTFQDPIVRVGSLDAFALNLRLLRTVFDVGFDLHSCRPSGPTEVVTRCVPAAHRNQID
jgi:hypothetical protein